MQRVVLAILLLALVKVDALLPRQKAPLISAISVKDNQFTRFNSSDFLGRYLVLVFYPFDYTYVCPTELVAFSEAFKEFEGINTKVVGISTDSHFTHLAWTKTSRKEGGVGQLNIALLADISKDISRDYGVLVTDKEDELYGASLRGLFIIDAKGVVRSVLINDASVGRSVDETLRTVKAFQHSDLHGDVCPANWEPGQATIIPHQDKKQQYFQNVKQENEL